MTEPKELTGIEGLTAARADANNWEVQKANGEWIRCSRWNDWDSISELSDPARRWRRIAGEPAVPRRFTCAPIYVTEHPTSYSSGTGLRVSVMATGPWLGKCARITVEELIDLTPRPADEPEAVRPGLTYCTQDDVVLFHGADGSIRVYMPQKKHEPEVAAKNIQWQR